MFDINEVYEKCGVVIMNARNESQMIMNRVKGGNTSAINRATEDLEYYKQIVENAGVLTMNIEWLNANANHPRYRAVELMVNQMYEFEDVRTMAEDSIRSGYVTPELNQQCVVKQQDFIALAEAVRVIKGI